jgi:hypothetical protein
MFLMPVMARIPFLDLVGGDPALLAVPDDMKVHHQLAWYWFSIFSAIPNFGRLALAAIFVSSYMLKPLHKVISVLWARIVESDKPIFTILFGGGAAAAKAVEAVIQAL